MIIKKILKKITFILYFDGIENKFSASGLSRVERSAMVQSAWVFFFRQFLYAIEMGTRIEVYK
jgi:hypothetical protein